MTLCVGAFGENGDTLATANDLMVAFGGSSGTNIANTPALMKNFHFHDTWLGTFAGAVSPVEPVLDRVLKRLEGAPNSFNAVVSAFTDSFKDERKQHLTDRVLAKYGLDYDTFLRDGKGLLKRGQYEKMWEELRDYDLGTQFLVGGFDDTGKQHLFTVADPGFADHHTGHGYCAIGIGQEEALRMMGFRGYNWGQVSATQCIYSVLEAKIFGEGPLVGRETVVTAINVKKSLVLQFYAKTHATLRLLIKQGRRSEAEAEIDKMPWGPLKPGTP